MSGFQFPTTLHSNVACPLQTSPFISAPAQRRFDLHLSVELDFPPQTHFKPLALTALGTDAVGSLDCLSQCLTRSGSHRQRGGPDKLAQHLLVETAQGQ